MTKLTDEQIEEVRDMYRGVWTVSQIARYFKVSTATIQNILNRKGPYNRWSTDPTKRGWIG